MRELKGSEILVIYNNKEMTELGVKCRLTSAFTYEPHFLMFLPVFLKLGPVSLDLYH